MIKINFKKFLVGGIVLSALSLLGLPSVSAAGLDETVGVGDKDAKSYGHITIEANDETEEPTGPIVEPEDPDDSDGGTDNKGALRIDWVTPLEFGLKDLSVKTETYATTSFKPNVQVTDVRGTGEGWTLQVSMSEFEDSKTGNTLKGAELVLPEGTLVNQSGNESKKPSTYEVALYGLGAPKKIMSAEKDAGMGTWADLFKAEDVKLTIPSGNYAGDYQAELTWTLANAPQ